MVKGGLSALLGTAGLVVFALVQAKKDVLLEVGAGIFNGHARILGRDLITHRPQGWTTING
jgi:hypothetical protein